MSKKDISRLRKNQFLHFQLGMICAICFALFAFNYTSDGPARLDRDIIQELPIDPDIPVIRTAHPKPPPPPKPIVSQTFEVVDELPKETVQEEVAEKVIEVPITDEVVFVAEKPKEKTIVVKKPVKIVPIEDEEVIEPEIFTIVQQMPRFKGCAGITGEKEARACSEEKMLRFMYKNIKYPAIARENGIQGVVVIGFIVDKDGSVTDVEVLKPLGGGCSNEALRVIKKMPDWTPGKQRNTAVKVQYSLPINFNLK